MNDGTPLPSLPPDRLAAELGAGPIPEGYICFKGYLTSEGDDTHRLIVDQQFVRWLVIKTEDIAAVLDSPYDDPHGREHVFVRRNAQVAKCQVAYAYTVANEGLGVDPPPPGPPPPPYDEPPSTPART